MPNNNKKACHKSQTLSNVPNSLKQVILQDNQVTFKSVYLLSQSRKWLFKIFLRIVNNKEVRIHCLTLPDWTDRFIICALSKIQYVFWQLIMSWIKYICEPFQHLNYGSRWNYFPWKTTFAVLHFVPSRSLVRWWRSLNTERSSTWWWMDSYYCLAAQSETHSSGVVFLKILLPVGEWENNKYL